MAPPTKAVNNVKPNFFMLLFSFFVMFIFYYSNLIPLRRHKQR
jgi:hypothetical protein